MQKNIVFIFLILAVITAANAAELPYQDPEFQCITQGEASRYIADFGIDTESFGGVELCNSQVETKKLFNDLQIIEQGNFAGDTQNKFIRGFVDSRNYYGWLKQETRGIQRGNDIPYATAYNSGGYFTMQDGWAKLSTLGRVGTVVHEARHTAGYRHIACNQGPYQGSGVSGCDTNYSYGGSHAVEMEYYARVAVQGTYFHPVYQKMARLMAIARSNIFFNTGIIQGREAVLALTADRKAAHLFDRNTWYTREVPFAPGRLKRTSFGAVLFDGVKAFSIELYKNSGFADLVDDSYSYYKLVAEKNEQLKEFEEFDSGIKRYAIKISKSNKLASYDFPNGTWGREQTLPFDVARTSTAILGKNQSGLYLINTKGEIFSYTPENQRLVSQTLKWNPELKDVINFNGRSLVLKNDGRIYVLSPNSELIPWAETSQLYSDLIATPVYDGFEVVKE